MCRAIYEIKQDARREGRREGKKEGKIQGMQYARQKDILELLKDYGQVPDETKKIILKEKDMDKLGVWLKAAARADSIEEFRMAM